MKHTLEFDQPLMNSAGSLGYAPQSRGAIDLERLGAFVTNPVSLKKRTPAHGTRYLAYPGGFLLHTGLPNPGLKSVLKDYAPRWARQTLPIWVHLLAEGAEELSQMAKHLEGRDGVAGLEVGLPANADEFSVQALTRAACGELAVIVRLPLDAPGELAEAAVAAGAAAVSLGPPRGALLNSQGEIVSGRLYGPALFPLALQAVKRLTTLGLTVIGSGGIYSQRDVDVMLAAGAVAVQLDAALWRGWQI
jgi:dihydroorotate dehydrogenase (NAD+) catalytic subunit